MGVSTDAILCFGIALDDCEEIPWADKAEELGHDEPFDDEAIVHLVTGEKVEWPRSTEKLKELGLEIVTHCHYEEPMYILAVAGTVTSAHRGYTEEVDPLTMQISDRDLNRFEETIRKLGVETSIDNARWLLCVYWH